MELRSQNAREEQRAIVADIRIQGVPDWREPLRKLVTLDSAWAKVFGSDKVTLLKYLAKESEVHQHSFERSVVQGLLALGFELQELTVTFANAREMQWGKSVWYRDHPHYLKKHEHYLSQDMRYVPSNMWHAMWKTEYAGDQAFVCVRRRCSADYFVATSKEYCFTNH